MRICAVTPFPPTRSGIADYGACLVEGFARDPRVERVVVVADRAAGSPDRQRDGRIEIHRVWQRDRATIGPQVLRAIAAARADVVWFNLGLTIFGTGVLGAASGLAAVAAARLMRRTVVTLHELPSLSDPTALGFHRAHALAGSAVLPLLLRGGDVVVTLERYRAHVVDHHRARSVTHIPHGLWDRPERIAEPQTGAVLVVGMFGPHKDPGIVAEALRRIRPSHADVRLIVAGADHPRYPGFMAGCRARYQLKEEWAGYVPAESLPTLFARASVVVIPATASTGASGVIHRAVGYGRALVVSDLPDFRALAAEQDLAFEWFPPGDARRLAAALDALLSDPSRRHALASHNLRSAARVSPGRTVDAYLELFARHGRRPGWAGGRATARRARLDRQVKT